MFHNVLVGIDGSSSAAQALDRAIAIVRASHGRIGLLAVAAKPSRWIALTPFALPVSYAQVGAELEAEAQRHVDDAERRVPADMPVTKLVARGRAGEALLTHALDGPWDLIVVTDGWRQRRLHTSPVPVLVVRPGAEAITAPSEGRRLARAQLRWGARLHAR